MDHTHSKPINKTAARVLSRGDEYMPDKRVQNVHSELPLPTVQCGHNRDDLTGFRRGRLVAVGVWAERTDRWVMRCDCGAYTVRSAKAVRNPANEKDACEHCRHLMYLQRHDEYRQTGRNRERRQ